MSEYKHTQIGWALLSFLVPVTVLVSILIFSVQITAYFIFVILLCLFFILSFITLTVKIDNECIRFCFGIGIIRFKIGFDKIESCQQVKNPWYYFWAIKKIPNGWLFSVSGYDAVEITKKDGKIWRIGTDEPEKLLEIIQAKIEQGK